MDEFNSKSMLVKLMCIMKNLNQKTYEQTFAQKLYPGQPQMLVYLKHFEGISQKELAQKHRTKPASISGMLQNLEKQNLIIRTPDKKDKRILRVYLTDKGKDLSNQAEKFIDEVAEDVFFNFTSEEKESYFSILEKMSNNLERTERSQHEKV